jgi:hypothetical protein
MILATPVQYARVGYLQRKIRIANTDHSVEPGAPVFATAAPLAEQTDDAARPHRWCVRVAEGQPLRIVPRCSEELTSIVVEDPAAASALPAMEVVYSFVRWRGEFAVLEHGVRIDGQIVERSEVRLEREEDGSAILWEGGGEVRLRPGLNRRSAVATLVEPFETEDELRGAAGAISGNVRLQPAALTVSFGPSADRPAQFATPPQIFAEIPAATHYIRAYPAPAMERRLEGDTRLACVIRPSRRLRCIVLTETPAGRGFGLAALRISHEFRIVERLPDGRSTIGGALQIPIRFRLSN